MKKLPAFRLICQSPVFLRAFVGLVLLFAATLTASAQDARLAQQYFQNGEYEKAAVLFEKLYDQNNRNPYFFDRYVDCLLALEDYDKAEVAIKKQLKKEPENINLYVSYGKLLERQYKDEEAEQQYRLAIEKLPANQYEITRLANTFMSATKYDLATEVFEKGAGLLRDPRIFAYNLGDLYRRKGDTPKMVESYLISLDAMPERLESMKVLFQRFLLPEEYRELQTQLYARIQQDDRAIYFNELLTWVFIQQKDYKNALRQVKALDKRLDENGGRIYTLGDIAATDRAFDAAIEAYDYVVTQKGPTSSFYLDAKRESLRCRRLKLTEGFDFSREELLQLEGLYNTFLDEFGRSKSTAAIILELAELEALYLNNLDKAIAMLDEMIRYPNVERNVEAVGKINLADYYLMKGERWESTLLYSQVDKAFKEDVLGHEARFRNAKLSYYNGDFQWAQSQFDVLKASTSKLIANDALDLSVFIMDNLGLDSTATALEMYSTAELLVFQNRFDEAFSKLDSMLVLFPEHSLDDDVIYLKSKVYRKQRQFDKMAESLQTIIDKYKDGIRADNAMFELAELYERQLNDIEKAKTLYETLFIDFSGSTFAVEARKRFRALRGDKVR